MKTAASKWPIVPPDSRLLALEELTEKGGLTFGSAYANGSSNRLCRWRRLERGAWDAVRRLPISSQLLAELLSEILEEILDEQQKIPNWVSNPPTAGPLKSGSDIEGAGGSDGEKACVRTYRTKTQCRSDKNWIVS